MRVCGFRVPPPLARFARFRAQELRAWPRESFLRVGGGLYVRSWSMEQLPRLRTLFGSRFHPEKLVDLKIWRPWWVVFPSLKGPRVVLTCEPYGRFGNRIVQTAVGVAAANILKAGALMLRTHDFLNNVSSAELGGVRLLTVKPGAERLSLEGLQTTSTLIVEANWLLSQRAFSDRSDISAGFSSLRRACLVPHLGKPEESSEFAVHFRGTDQLSKDWRPPPLAFFVKAALHAKVKSLLLVTDDPTHHLVAELLFRLRAERIESRIQSSSLHEDSQTLLQASTLCFGVGTFASSLAGISKNLRATYSWSQPDWSTWADFTGSFDLRPDVENFQIFDSSDTYTSRFRDIGEFSDAAVADHMARFTIKNLAVRRIAPISVD